MSNQDLEQILSQLDNEKFFIAQGLNITKRRGKSWPCTCPFCGDKEHFNFDPKTGQWQCFKCSEKGNAVSFYAKIHNCSNGDAVKAIKQFLGIPEEDVAPKKNVHKNSKNTSKKSDSVHKNTATVHPFPAKNAKEQTPPQQPQQPGRPHVYERLVQLTHLTPEHREEFYKKRGFNDTIIDSLRFRSGGEYITGIVEQMQQEYPKDELINAGLLVEVNGTTVVNDQLLDGRVLIPYLDEMGLCYHLRPHKLGFKGIPVQPYCRLFLKNRPEHIILAESEFKATALHLGWGIPAIGIPGIPAFGDKNLPRLIDFLKEYDVRKVTVIFDSEEKGNPAYPNFKEKLEDRYDTQYWSYMMAYLLNKKGGFQTRVGWLPAEWRDEGKIDFDGALAQGRSREEILKVIDTAKIPNEFLDKLDDDAKKIVKRKITRHFAKVNIDREFNKYKVKKYREGKEIAEEYISNFVLNIKASFYTPNGAVRNVELINENGEVSEPFPIEPGSMAGVNEFRKFLLGKGNYLWEGTANDLNNMWKFEFARDTGEFIMLPEQIGRIKKDLWLFGNMAIKGNHSYRPDADGIIWIDGKGYKPQSFSVGPQGEQRENAIPALYDKSIDIELIADRLRHCIGGYEAYMMLGWVVATIFSNDIFNVYKSMPILFPHGKRESGKTTAMRWIMNFFGNEGDGISVGRTTTQNYVARVMSYYNSLGVWFDEYRNETGVIEKDGLFRSAYNRQLSGKGTATSFQSKGFSVYSTLAISGEELPRDNGLFTRCIPLQMSSYKRNRKHFSWLNNYSTQFSGFTYHLITNYELYKQKILDTIAEMKTSLVKREVTDRTAENWAICAGAFWAVIKQESEFFKWVEKNCQEIRKAGEGEHMLSQFWDDLNYLLSEGTLGAKHFKVENEKLYIWYEGIYVAWSVLFRKKTGRDPFDKMSILKYLTEEPYYLDATQKRLYGGSARRVHGIDLKLAPENIKELAGELTKTEKISEY